MSDWIKVEGKKGLYRRRGTVVIPRAQIQNACDNLRNEDIYHGSCTINLRGTYVIGSDKKKVNEKDKAS